MDAAHGSLRVWFIKHPSQAASSNAHHPSLANGPAAACLPACLRPPAGQCCIGVHLIWGRQASGRRCCCDAAGALLYLSRILSSRVKILVHHLMTAVWHLESCLSGAKKSGVWQWCLGVSPSCQDPPVIGRCGAVFRPGRDPCWAAS